MPVLTVKTNAKSLGTVRPPGRDLEIGQINLRGDRGEVANLLRAVTSAELQTTIEGASTLTLKIRDHSRNLLRSVLSRTRSTLTLDGVEYALVKVARDGNELTYVLEDLAVNLLRRYSKPRKANRANTTRAQFIRGLIQEPSEALIPFFCPELNERQPILKPDTENTGPSAGLRAVRVVGANDQANAQLSRLRVKGAPASRHQLEMGKLIVLTTRQRGGDRESCAGAVATAIQESGMTNISHGDRDSLGLYQQRPSMGWGSAAQVTTPTYAIGKFLDQYLAYRKKGYGWLTASHKTQRSAHPSAPARWYSEGQAFTAAFIGSGGGLSSVSLGAGDTGTETSSYQVTRVEPYEFSRGSADQRETSWQCARRLADEVQWRFFSRGGQVWYVSDQWLGKQRPVARVGEFTIGVVALTFEYETRRRATEATLTVLTRRYALLPGDIVEILDEGPGSGKWLISSTRRNLSSRQTEVTLTRQRAALPEPAPTTRTETVTVKTPTGSSRQETSGMGALNGAAVANSGAPLLAQRAYAAGEEASAMRWRYSQPRRNDQRSGGYADCSSGVSWVLTRAGIPIPGAMRPNAPVSGAYTGWGEPGPGRYFTVMANAGHIWIRWNGIGSKWRFDTGGGSGGTNWATPRSVGGFVQRHWRGL